MSQDDKQLKLVHKLADNAVESASQKDLTQFYWDDAFNYYNDCDLETLTEIAENVAHIRVLVNTWLNANPNEMIDLMEDFSSELKHDKDFSYECGQFRCWVWDTMLKDKL